MGTLTLNTWYRIEFRLTQSGTARLAVFLGDSLTPVTDMDSGARTGLNFGGDNFSSIRIGAKASTSSVTSSGYFDDFAYDPAVSSTFIGPYTEVLPTPTVTLGAKTNPTTVGGSNGTQPASWPVVPGAGSYDAYRADGTAPAQGDFVLVASGVTSPYTFTGLDAGDYAYGIKAKA